VNIKEAMQYYAEMGLPVIPLCPHNHAGMSELHSERCKRPGKHPLLKEWQTRGVPTPQEIDQWFQRWPLLNIGLLLGRPSGFVGIDVDGEGGQLLLRQMSGDDLPPTWTFTTPNDGMRYLYRIPSNKVLKKAGKTDPTQAHVECALLGEGCQTVLPPSTHANGGRYQWITGPIEVN
jgi:hypothetical protein